VGMVRVICLILKNTTNRGLPLWRLLGMVFRALVRAGITPMNRVDGPVEKESDAKIDYALSKRVHSKLI